MPGIEELMAMQGGGGGPPQGGGMPPQGGGGGGMAGAMIQKLQQLMQDPVASQAIMQKAQQMGLGGGGGAPLPGGAPGQDPRMALAGPRGSETMRGGVNPGVMSTEMLAGAGQGGFSGPSTDGAIYDTLEANQGVRGDLPPRPGGPYTGYAEEMEPMDDPRQTPMPSDGDSPETRMINREIDRKGATFDGVDAPTQNDIDRILEAPTDMMLEAFDAQFGDGAAAQYLDPEGKSAGTTPKEPAEEVVDEE